MECLPGSSLPDDLRKLGYDVRETGEGERILPAAITERLAQRDDGSLAPVMAGSTVPVTTVVQHAGIVKVQRFTFGLLSTRAIKPSAVCPKGGGSGFATSFYRRMILTGATRSR